MLLFTETLPEVHQQYLRIQVVEKIKTATELLFNNIYKLGCKNDIIVLTMPDTALQHMDYYFFYRYSLFCFAFFYSLLFFIPISCLIRYIWLSPVTS